MYDKFGRVLRIETVINRPYEFRVRRRGRRGGKVVTAWLPMGKGVANLYRYQEVQRAANLRYLEALAGVENPRSGYRALHRICEPVSRQAKRFRGLNPLRRREIELFSSVMRGEHSIHGFRNRDVAAALKWERPADPAARKRRSARVSRKLQLLRAHGLIAKIPNARRYRVTTRGATLMGAVIVLEHQDLVPKLANTADASTQKAHPKACMNE